MKHIKTYESLTEDREPQVGDYVICQYYDVSDKDEEQDAFVATHIGKIISIIDEETYPYNVKFIAINSEIETGTHKRRFRRREIKYYSPNIEDLELIMNANKYNL
jgi:hypothetical protein